jgi:hypothetical protein
MLCMGDIILPIIYGQYYMTDKCLALYSKLWRFGCQLENTEQHPNKGVRQALPAGPLRCLRAGCKCVNIAAPPCEFHDEEEGKALQNMRIATYNYCNCSEPFEF